LKEAWLGMILVLTFALLGLNISDFFGIFPWHLNKKIKTHLFTGDKNGKEFSIKQKI